MAAVGASEVELLADELDDDCSWMQRQQPPTHLQQQAPQLTQSQSQQQPVQQESEREQISQGHHWWRRHHNRPGSIQRGVQQTLSASAVYDGWQIPPAGVQDRVWQRAVPLILQVGLKQTHRPHKKCFLVSLRGEVEG